MFVLYVLDGCPYCERAIQMLKQEKCKYKTVVVPREEATKNIYKKKFEMNSFPMIFVENEKNHYLKVGGSTDLEEYFIKAKEFQQSNLAMDIFYSIYKNLFSKS